MANPSADYPTAVHTPTDVSANTAVALGASSPTHTDVEGKQEAEIVAIQTKIGIGASPASSATDGQVLTKQADGSTAWETGAGSGDMIAATYDPASISEQLVGLTATQTLTNKTLTSPFINEAVALTSTATELNLLDGITTLSGSNTGDESAASATTSGISELATIAEIDTGTDTGRTITPAGLAGSALQTKVDGIEALADVTDTANVTSAGALMDSEVDADIKTLVLPASTTISTFGASLIDDAAASNARTTLDVDQAGTDNSTNVTLAGTGTYISLSGQIITVDPITESDISDLGSYITASSSDTLTNKTIDVSNNTFLNAGELDMLKIGTPQYSNMKNIQGTTHSTGLVAGGVITNNGDGTVAVAAGDGLIKPTDSDVANLYSCEWAADASVSLTDNSINYIYLAFVNTSTDPAITVATSKPSDLNTNILLGTVYRSGTENHVTLESSYNITNHIKKMIDRFQETEYFSYASGSVLSETGTRNIATTAGAFWNGLNKITTIAQDSSEASPTGNTFEYFYRDGSSGWTTHEVSVTAAVFAGSGLDDASSGGTFCGSHTVDIRVTIDGTGGTDTFKWEYITNDGVTWITGGTGVSMTGAAQELFDCIEVTFAATTGHTLSDVWTFSGRLSTQIDNTQYDNNSGALQPLTANRYGVHWVYIDVHGHVAVLFGQGDYTISNANDAQPPSSLPAEFETHVRLIGKILIQKSASTFTSIENNYGADFQGSVPTDHGDLSGLTDDDHTQYVLADGSRGTYVGETSITILGTIATGTWQGTAINQTYLVGQSGTNTGDEPAADLTTPGIVELATGAETNTGTDATRAVTPDGLDDWTGSAQITTLGTIATGVWNGTDIAVTDGGTGASDAATALLNLGGIGAATTDTLSNKTLTLPQINDTSSDHQYIFAVSELVADRTVTLPLLTGADTFVFEAHTQTLTNKTINTASNTITVVEADISDLGSYITASSTDTLTNKTFDANGTGNSLSNVDMAADVTGTLPIANGGTGNIVNQTTILDTAGGADHTASGTIASMTVGESIVVGDLLYMKSDGKLWKADASAAATAPGIAIAIAIISADAAGNVLLNGFMRDDTWAWTVGTEIFMSETTGALTQTAPSATTTQVQVIGVATHADRMFFAPSLTVVENT